MKTDAIAMLIAVLMLFALHCDGAVFCTDRSNTFLDNPSSQGTSLSPVTNMITVMFRHTVISNAGGNYISRNNTPFRLKTSGVAPQQFDFVYTDFLGANHQWRTTTESYNVTGYNLTACTFTFGTGSSFKFYTNGVAQSGSWIAGSGNVLATNQDAATRMWGHGSGAGGQEGYYSDFSIWNSILSEQQINLIRNAKVKGIEKQVNPSTLKMWIPLDGWPNAQSVGVLKTNLFVDRSGNNNHFTWPGGGATSPSGIAERVCSYQPNE